LQGFSRYALCRRLRLTGVNRLIACRRIDAHAFSYTRSALEYEAAILNIINFQQLKSNDESMPIQSAILGNALRKSPEISMKPL
jgi:hypothetical protein